MRDSAETSEVIRFGSFEVDGGARELRKEGVRIKLQEQPFQVLVFLLEHAGRVVTRDELRQKVWPSNVYVDFDHGLNNAIARLREALGDVAGTSRFIETVPRVGYRFIHPVERSSPAVIPVSPSVEMISQARRLRRVATGALAAGVLGLISIWLVWRPFNPSRPPELPKEPSIAVLPFDNMSEDLEKGHFADGLAEEVLDKLAGIHGLKVAGRASSFYFKNKQMRPAAIAEALKVNHLLEGSVRRSGSRVRVTVQLIDARDGYHRWSQTYDREVADILQVQEDIALAVAKALQVKLLEGDRIRLRSHGTRDVEAQRLYLMGDTLMRGHGVNRDRDAAKKFFEAALARDPTFAAPQAGIAMTYFAGAWFFEGVEECARLGPPAAQRAVALDPQSSDALVARANFAAWRYRFRGDAHALQHAHQDYRRAIELDPSSSTAYFNYGRAIEWTDPDLATRLFERTAELDPLWDLALTRSANLLSRRGMHDAARKRLSELTGYTLTGLELAKGILERNMGRLDEALLLLSDASPVEPGLLVWSLHASLDDLPGAREALAEFGDTEFGETLRRAALLSTDSRFEAAYESLERDRQNFPLSRLLDLPAARFALITGHADHARMLLESRLPDLVRGTDPVNARNLIPALDLAAAYARTGRDVLARQLLSRSAAYLDSSDAPVLPMFTYLRARTHALAGEKALAQSALDRAYEEGFRLTWGIDLMPGLLFYIDPIDADPAFAVLRESKGFKDWRERIRADNARQLKRFQAATRKLRTA